MDKGFKEKILSLRDKGLTYKEIKEELGCSQSTISYHCRGKGLTNLYELKKT